MGTGIKKQVVKDYVEVWGADSGDTPVNVLTTESLSDGDYKILVDSWDAPSSGQLMGYGMQIRSSVGDNSYSQSWTASGTSANQVYLRYTHNTTTLTIAGAGSYVGDGLLYSIRKLQDVTRVRGA